MKTREAFQRGQSPCLARFGASLAALLLWTGCETSSLKKPVIGPDYRPANVYRLGDRLPAELRRVAVLPLTSSETQTESGAGGLALETVLQTELLKTGRFELAWISPDALGRWTGKRSWDTGEKLPEDFFVKLREQMGCDGVMFCQLSRFKPYPPLVIGWHLTLVNAKTSETLWAVDELFDSGEPSVSNSARRYESGHQTGGPYTDAPLILTSPSRFGQYTAWAALSTLPGR